MQHVSKLRSVHSETALEIICFLFRAQLYECKGDLGLFWNLSLRYLFSPPLKTLCRTVLLCQGWITKHVLPLADIYTHATSIAKQWVISVEGMFCFELSEVYRIPLNFYILQRILVILAWRISSCGVPWHSCPLSMLYWVWSLHVGCSTGLGEHLMEPCTVQAHWSGGFMGNPLWNPVLITAGKPAWVHGVETSLLPDPLGLLGRKDLLLHELEICFHFERGTTRCGQPEFLESYRGTVARMKEQPVSSANCTLGYF